MVKNAQNMVDLFHSFKEKQNTSLFLVPIVPIIYILTEPVCDRCDLGT